MGKGCVRFKSLEDLALDVRFAGRELYDSVGREPTLRLDGDVLGREAGHRIWEFREATSCGRVDLGKPAPRFW
jgi:hypothetical protein